MIYTKTEFGDDAVNALIKLSMETPQMKKQRRTLKILFLVMAVCMLVLTWTLHQTFLIAVCLAFVLAAFFGVRPIQLRALNKFFSGMDEKLRNGTREYVFNEEGVKITSEIANGLSKWESFEETGEIDDYVWLRRVDNQVILVEKNSLTPEKTSELEGYLANVKKKNG